MKYVVIDLEMNPLGKDHKAEGDICKSEIIEIGAVALDEAYNELGTFVTLVKPQLNEVIEKQIETLTGIKTEMVESEPYFWEAVEKFLEWCDGLEDDLQLIQWSGCDREQFTREMLLKNVHLTDSQEKLINEWYDLQKEYGEKLELEKNVSLKNALMYAGVDYVGREHDALYDARNTAVLLKTVRIPELRRIALDKVIDDLHTKPLNTSIGDMFDFSQFKLPV